jgi:hypothetical protein
MTLPPPIYLTVARLLIRTTVPRQHYIPLFRLEKNSLYSIHFENYMPQEFQDSITLSIALSALHDSTPETFIIASRSLQHSFLTHCKLRTARRVHLLRDKSLVIPA